jgi:diaminopimelate epimerase
MVCVLTGSGVGSGFPMRFTKMEGAGNDYVYVDLFDETVELADAPQLAREVSDRNFGVGGDGLILLAPSTIADVRMIMFNADGSRAEMCGNGVRCLAKLAHDRGRAANNSMRVETDGGVREVELRFRVSLLSLLPNKLGLRRCCLCGSVCPRRT